MDLTKDFFFSYSYNVMCSFQKNMCDDVAETVLYETMFVWNEFLSCGIRNLVKNTLWTVALVYGFFKQVLVGCHIFLFIYVCVCVYCVWFLLFPSSEYNTSSLCSFNLLNNFFFYKNGSLLNGVVFKENLVVWALEWFVYGRPSTSYILLSKTICWLLNLHSIIPQSV